LPLEKNSGLRKPLQNPNKLIELMDMVLAGIFDQLKELEKKFNEIKYPPEATFQPLFCSRTRKAARDSLEYNFPEFEIDEFFRKVEK
jgi:hypothetical protein